MFLCVTGSIRGMTEQVLDRAALGRLVAAARKRKGWSKERAAREAGISSITWKRVEDGLPVQDAKLSAVMAAVDADGPDADWGDMLRVAGAKSVTELPAGRDSVDAALRTLELTAKLVVQVLNEGGDAATAAKLLANVLAQVEQMRRGGTFKVPSREQLFDDEPEQRGVPAPPLGAAARRGDREEEGPDVSR